MDPLRQAAAKAEQGDWAGAWAELGPLAPQLAGDPRVAAAWLTLLYGDPSHPLGPELEQIAIAHQDQPWLLALVGRLALRAEEQGDPTYNVATIVPLVLAAAEQAEDEALAAELTGQGAALLRGLGRHQEAYEWATRGLTRWPDKAGFYYDRALAGKRLGHFEQAVRDLKEAQQTLGADEPSWWNLAICATGAGHGELALAAWRALGHEAELGPGRLPLMANLGDVIVRTQGGAEDLWVRPQSPCHGVVLSVPSPAAKVGYGDTVLWDGQPLGQLTIRGRVVHHFPLLSVLRPGDAHTLPFWGQQPGPGAFLALNQQLPDAVWLHVRGEESRPIAPPSPRPEGAHPVEGQVVIEAELGIDEGRRLVEAAAAQAGLRLSFDRP
ncbi:MAG: hypothetical protein IPG45_14825 [Deltaproteobacteria bacterium]|jgi:hypothetical protein|nr:hypothetical protein [Deltaproteobacteria bacterium]